MSNYRREFIELGYMTLPGSCYLSGGYTYDNMNKNGIRLLGGKISPFSANLILAIVNPSVSGKTRENASY
jgi:hypothetical protein